MYPKQVPSFRQYPTQQQPMQKQLINPNKTLSWSSINSNYQQSISPLNYKVSNPSSSLVMSSLSHIREDDFETTGSSVMYQNGKGSSRECFHKKKQTGKHVHDDFYEYLSGENVKQNVVYKKRMERDEVMNQQSFEQAHNSWEKQEPHTKNPSVSAQDYMVPKHNKNFTLMNYHSGCSAQQSLQHLQRSQQELQFLKYKLQEAYQKLQKQIMNSYHLQETVQSLRVDLEGKQELIELERSENQKLKFTLKAIMKNKSFLQDEIEKEQTKKTTTSQIERQNQLKQSLRLKLQLKDLNQKINTSQSQISSLHLQNTKLKQQLSYQDKEMDKLKTQLTKKDQYLQTLSQQLQLSEELKTQNKKLLFKQTQYLNKINVLELELRKVTDQKVTSVSRLKHQIAIVHKHNQQLLQDNQSLAHNQAHPNTTHHHFLAYSPTSLNKIILHKSSNKYSHDKNLRTMTNIPFQAPMIFDSEDQDPKNLSHFGDLQQCPNSKTLIPNDSLNLNISNKRSKNSPSNKENVQCQNLQQSIVSQVDKSDVQKIDKSVGKWKRAQSVSNNCSVYFQGSSTQQVEGKQQPSLKSRVVQKDDSLQNMKCSKLSTVPTRETEDQKLTKYQQHRKNLQNQLWALQKLKRPSKQERQKMQKLQKQLYYIDSDIAGLKRRIRRKY